jgi:hypothetical protein
MNRRTSLAVLAGFTGAFTLGAAEVLAARSGTGGSTMVASVTGAILGPLATVTGQFAGSFVVQEFLDQAGRIVARGLLSGVLSDLAGALIGTVKDILVTLPVTIPTATCTVLKLVLGPLDLTLLGLEVHLNQVVLEINADPSGGLLGQLLCAIAGTTIVAGLVNLLNSLLQLFSGR